MHLSVGDEHGSLRRKLAALRDDLDERLAMLDPLFLLGYRRYSDLVRSRPGELREGGGFSRVGVTGIALPVASTMMFFAN